MQPSVCRVGTVEYIYKYRVYSTLTLSFFAKRQATSGAVGARERTIPVPTVLCSSTTAS